MKSLNISKFYGVNDLPLGLGWGCHIAGRCFRRRR